MILENTGRRTFQHSYLDEKGHVVLLNLSPKTHKEIPNEIADKWLKSGEVREYVSPAEAKAKEDALKAENEALKAELEKLKAAEEKPAETKKKKNGKHK